jgi:lipopolysaccharide export system protein LptA
VDSPKTKQLAARFKAMNLDSVLVIAEEVDENLYLASRNLVNVLVVEPRYADPLSLVHYKKVLVTKGAIIMRGKQIEVKQDAQGNQVGVLTGTPAQPGFFRQKREGLDEWIEGEGVRIEYDSKSEIIRFSGSAVLRRYRGEQINDEARGNQIVYNSATEVFTVKGNEPGRDAANPSGRVRAMLTPTPTEGAAPSSTPADPATLRPSGQIKENSQ